MTSIANERVIIEVADVDVGIAIRERGGFRLHIADPRFRTLDGTMFKHIDHIKRAVKRLLTPRDEK